MNLTHFPTPAITYKSKKYYPVGKLFKIASFSLFDDDYPTGVSSAYKLEIQVAQMLQLETMSWVVGESFGGLFYRARKVQKLNSFRLVTEVELYVYIPHEIYTFCQLKFGENLTKMK